MPTPSDETVLLILTVLELLGKRETPEHVVNTYRIGQRVLRERPIKTEKVIRVFQVRKNQLLFDRMF